MTGEDNKPRREERSHGEDYPDAVDADTVEERYATPTPTPAPEADRGPGKRKHRKGGGGVRSVGDVAARFGPEEKDR